MKSVSAFFFSFKFSFLLFSLSGVCILAYNTIGSTVDADGFLQEPFFLIPIGWLLFLGGLGVGIIATFRSFMKQR